MFEYSYEALTYFWLQVISDRKYEIRIKRNKSTISYKESKNSFNFFTAIGEIIFEYTYSKDMFIFSCYSIISV
jgi:hypothetical protein